MVLVATFFVFIKKIFILVDIPRGGRNGLEDALPGGI